MISAQSIIKVGFDSSKTKKRDNHWLGDGFYFFQYLADAESWAKSTYYCNSSPTIIKCDLICQKEQFLDLDNPSEYSEFLDHFDRHLKLTENEITLNFKTTEHAMHFGLNLYAIEYNTKLIKKTFQNPRTSKALKYKFLGYKFQYQYSEVQFCATDDDIIKNKEIM